MAVKFPLRGGLALVACLAFSSQAMAISRVDTSRISCSAVKSLLADEGAAILRYPSRTNPSHMLYDRYVSGRPFCQLGQITERMTVPAADTKTCWVKRCVWTDSEDRMRLRPVR